MPTVRRYGERQVGVRPIAGTRGTAAATPESLGAGLARQQAATAETVADVARQGASLATGEYREVRRKAYEQGLRDVDLDTDNQLAATQRGLEQRILDTKGQDVKGLRESVLGDFRKSADKIAAGLTDDTQRYNFATRRAQREQSLDVTALRWTDQQLEVSRKAQTAAGIDNARYNIRAHATDDGFRVQDEVTRALEILHADGERQGLPAEALKANEAELKSALLTDHITSLLAAGQTQKAQVAWDAYQGAIVGANRDNVQEAVRRGSVLGEAQRVAGIITASDDKLSDWIAKAEARGLEPTVLEEVKRQLREKDAIRDSERREADRANTQSLANWIDTQPRALVTRAQLQLQPEWSALDASSRSGLLAYLDHKVVGSKPQTDLRAWTTLADLRRDDPAAFAVKDLTPYLGKLSETDYQQFKDQQTSLVAGGVRASSVVRTVSIDDNLFKTIATSAGVNVYPPTNDTTGRERVDTLRYNVEQAIGDAQVKTKRELTYDEKKTVMAGVLDAHVWLNQWGTDPELPAAAVVNAERATAYVPIARIPKVTITEFSNYVRSVSPITAKWDQAQILSEYEDRFQRAYAALVMRLGDAEVRRRLEGR